MIKVCDAIMGTGKSQSAITYMNENPHNKYIYITPYLEEASRIKKSCPQLHFREPSDKLKEYGFRKYKHTAELIRQGENITTTHQAFKSYTDDVLQDISRQGYTLIIDENVDILEKFDFNNCDLELLQKAGYLKEHKGVYSKTELEYNGDAFKELFSLISRRDIVLVTDRNKDTAYYWTLPPELITSFKDVFILTYLFKSQSIHHFLEIYSLPYEYIGIEKDGDIYRFGAYPGYTPEYVKDIKKKIHILDHKKLNEIGDDKYALSMAWFDRDNNIDQLQKHIANYFRNITADCPQNDRLWGTYNKGYNKLKGKGYTKSFLTFNAKATNDFRNCRSLVYIANVFMNVGEKVLYQAYGIDVDEDTYALSIMVQWIWRSAIRDGNDIDIYIPSRRMRELLIKWLDDLEKGGGEYAS